MADKISEREKAAYNRRINDSIEDGKDPKSTFRSFIDARRAPSFGNPSFGNLFSAGKTRESDSAKRDLARGGYDAMLNANPEESGMKRGGIVRSRGDGVAARGRTKGRMI